MFCILLITGESKMSYKPSDGGKGSKPRPVEDKKKFEDNWDKIFKKPKPENKDDKTKNSIV